MLLADVLDGLQVGLTGQYTRNCTVGHIVNAPTGLRSVALGHPVIQ